MHQRRAARLGRDISEVGFGAWQIGADWGAIDDIWKNHKIVATVEEASALAVRKGVELECGQG